MIELEVKHTGDGRFEVTNRQDWETAKQEIDVGAVLKAEFKFPRSSRENRLLHGAIKSAYDNQRGGPMFSEEEGGWLKLRAWLLTESGHCNVYEFDAAAISRETVQALKRRDAAENVYSFWALRQADKKIICKTPRTIRFSVVKHPDFQPVKTRMIDLLCTVICPGTTPEQLMDERYVRPKMKRVKKASNEHAASGNQVGEDSRAA